MKAIPETMYICLIGLFLGTFQVTCDGAPERSFLALKLPVDVSQEKKLVEKRARKYSPWLQSSLCFHEHSKYIFFYIKTYIF